ncbi:MAG: hypothetical protein HRF50_06680 [Phycisphaerae bacterium]|jgi:hypothetical protein
MRRKLGAVWLLGSCCLLALGQATVPRPGAAAAPVAAGQREIDTRAVLCTRLPALKFERMPLSDAFELIEQLSGATIAVRWERLVSAGVARDEPVSLDGQRLRLDQALWLIMNQPALADARLAYRAEGTVIIVSTADDFAQLMITKVYDVTDLLATRLRYPHIAVGRTHEVVTGNTVATAAGAVAVQPRTERFDSGVYYEGEDSGGGEVDRDVLIRQLVDTIVATVEPESWALNGGPGTIIAFQNKLVVRNSPLVHQKLGGPTYERDAP